MPFGQVKGVEKLVKETYRENDVKLQKQHSRSLSRLSGSAADDEPPPTPPMPPPPGGKKPHSFIKRLLRKTRLIIKKINKMIQ